MGIDRKSEIRTIEPVPALIVPWGTSEKLQKVEVLKKSCPKTVPMTDPGSKAVPQWCHGDNCNVHFSNESLEEQLPSFEYDQYVSDCFCRSGFFFYSCRVFFSLRY